MYITTSHILIKYLYT